MKPFYSGLRQPSIDPPLMIRMLIVGFCIGIRSKTAALRSPQYDAAHITLHRRLGLATRLGPLSLDVLEERLAAVTMAIYYIMLLIAFGDLTLSPRRSAFWAVCTAAVGRNCPMTDASGRSPRMRRRS